MSFQESRMMTHSSWPPHPCCAGHPLRATCPGWLVRARGIKPINFLNTHMIGPAIA